MAARSRGNPKGRRRGRLSDTIAVPVLHLALLLLLVSISTLPLASAHSRILSFGGVPARYQKDVCQAQNCWAPCGALKTDGNPSRLLLKRGQQIAVTWPRNNHPGGFIRWAVAPFNKSDVQSNFDASVASYSCFESKCFGAGWPSDPRTGDPPGTFENGNVCKGNFTVPRWLPNGQYTVQWIWFGGGAVRGNLFEGQSDWASCADFTVVGTEPVSARPRCPAFIGGDAYTEAKKMLGTKCQYFGNGNRQNACYPYRCPGDYSVGYPQGVERCWVSGPSRALYYTNNTDSAQGNPYGTLPERQQKQTECWANYTTSFARQQACWPLITKGRTTLAQCNSLLARMNAIKKYCIDQDAKMWKNYPMPPPAIQNYPIPEPNLLRGSGSTDDGQVYTPLVDQSNLSVSTTGRCGSSLGLRCPEGQCCSDIGYCSPPSTDPNSALASPWCSIKGGCQIGYGSCEYTSSCDLYPTSGSGKCGPDTGLKCPEGQCCGNDGQCSASTTACGNGCIRGYGKCLGKGAFVCGGAAASIPPGQKTVTEACPGIKVTTTGRCGPHFGYRRCQPGICCSSAGYCQDDGGVSGDAWCNPVSCERGFGKCGGSSSFVCPVLSK